MINNSKEYRLIVDLIKFQPTTKQEIVDRTGLYARYVSGKLPHIATRNGDLWVLSKEYDIIPFYDKRNLTCKYRHGNITYFCELTNCFCSIPNMNHCRNRKSTR